MDWFKRHADTVIVLGGILTSVFWMNSKFTQIEKRFAQVDLRFAEVNLKFAEIEKEISIMKTVLIMQGHFPKELAVNTDKTQS